MFKSPKELKVGDVILGHPYVTWTVDSEPVDPFKVGIYRVNATPSRRDYETTLKWNHDWQVEVAD